MNEDYRPNLYEMLKGEFPKQADKVLDVGFGKLVDLYELEVGPFTRLVGIDYDPEHIEYSFIRYCAYHSDDDVPKLGQLIDRITLERKFKSRFRLECSDIESFNFKANEYAFIICSQVLHFFPDQEKFKYIKKLYRSLQKGGLMFLRMVHCDDPFNKTLIEIGPCVFAPPPKEGEGLPKPRYPIKPQEFMASMASYEILDKYTHTPNVKHAIKSGEIRLKQQIEVGFICHKWIIVF